MSAPLAPPIVRSAPAPYRAPGVANAAAALCLLWLLLATATEAAGLGDAMTRAAPDWPRTATATELGLGALAAGILLAERAPTRRRTIAALATVTGAGALLRLALHVAPPTDMAARAEALLFDGMAPASAFALLCGAVSLLGMARRLPHVAGIGGATGMLGACAMGLFGYAQEPEALHRFAPFAQMALPTALMGAALGAGLLCCRRRSVTRNLLCGARAGSRAARAHIPAKTAAICAIFAICFADAPPDLALLGADAAIAAITLGATSSLLMARRADLSEAEAARREAAARRADRRRAAAQLAASRQRRAAETEKREALGRVVGGVAHGINNTLTALSGNLELMGLESSAERRGACQAEALEAVVRIRDMTARLVSAGRRQVLFPAPTPVAPIAREALDALCAATDAPPGLRAELDVADAPCALCDPKGLRQALDALLRNAADASPSGGRIRVEARLARAEEAPGRPAGAAMAPKADEAPGEACAGAGAEDAAVGHAAEPAVDPSGAVLAQALRGGAVIVAVEDDGEGMRGETLRRAADPFFSGRDRPDRPGLGLSMVEGYCIQSGGTLRFGPAPQGRFRVEMRLPLAGPAPAEPATLQDAPSASAGRPDRRLLH